VQAVTDLYSTAFETEPQRKKMAVPTLTGVYHANLSVHEGKSRTELGLEAAQSVLLVCAEPQIEKIDYHKEKGRLTVEGTARCNALLSCGTDAPCLDAAFPLPFRFELSGIFMEGDAEYRYDCYVVSSSGRLDSTQLYPNLELGLDILVSSVEEKELVESVSLVPGAPIAPCEQMIFCYPSAQQSLWEIAKEYGVSYPEMRELLLNDERFSRAHTFVYDEHPYWESHCFDKDLRAIAGVSDAPLIDGVIRYNERCKSRYGCRNLNRETG
jgi:hypothetical protein